MLAGAVEGRLTEPGGHGQGGEGHSIAAAGIGKAQWLLEISLLFTKTVKKRKIPWLFPPSYLSVSSQCHPFG